MADNSVKTDEDKKKEVYEAFSKKLVEIDSEKNQILLELISVYGNPDKGIDFRKKSLLEKKVILNVASIITAFSAIIIVAWSSISLIQDFRLSVATVNLKIETLDTIISDISTLKQDQKSTTTSITNESKRVDNMCHELELRLTKLED